MLAARSISKSFSGVQALHNVSVAIGANEVVGLIGENGAGKSTLMRILSGTQAPDSGVLTLDGAPLRLARPVRGGRACFFEARSRPSRWGSGS